MIVASIAALCALGVVVLSGGLYRLNHRAVTARRVAALLVDEPRPAAMPARRAQWRIEIRHMLAELDARGGTLRGPFVVLACVCGLFGLASVSSAWFGLAAASSLLAYALGGRERRRQRIEAQALDAMGLLASGLRAGYSVPQAIALVARHSPQPTAAEFALAAQEISVGVELADAIARLARRNANPDYALVAIIIRVQHEVGGNLAQILESVSNTLRERLELRRQVNAVTAQQRLSSIVLTVLPFALLTVLSIMDRAFVEPLFIEPVGRFMLAISGVMVLVGWTIMRSIGRVEV